MFDNGQYVTIQQTGKTWKLLWVLSKLGVWGGLLIAFSPLYGGDAHTSAIGWLLFIVCFIVSRFAKLGAWWHHG